ncbi:MAG: hypothetical protein IPJ98_00320 [Bryobacterales bacterium]|nr:hypothetical protein [Bryobacterales bacterium]
MQPISPVDGAAMASRFHRLMGSFIRNDLRRNVFQPWEIRLLVDIATCQRDGALPKQMLRKYREVALRQIEDAGGPPMLLSEYLNSRRRGAKRSGLVDAAAVVNADG